MKKEDCSFFQNRSCEFYPCHKGAGEAFNCMFCYCPLYALGDRCGGNFRYTEKGIKDCSACMIPHSPGGYDYVLSKFNQVAEIARENHGKE